MVNKTEYLYELYVAHAQADRAWVYGNLLPKLNLPSECIITSADLRPGAPWVDELERAVKGSRYTLLVLSPAFQADAGAKLSEQMASFLSTAEQQIRLIPLVKEECELSLGIEFRVRLDCTSAENCKDSIGQLRTLLGRPEPVPDRLECPYPGMVPFRARDAIFFFGREKEIDEILRRLRAQNYLWVIGPSGSGKSSLVIAGLGVKLPEQQPGQYLIVKMRPGSDPLKANVTLIDDSEYLGNFNTLDVERCLTEHPPAQRLMLIVDQFEELFALSDKAEQSAFIPALQGLRATGKCTVVLTLRADFYPDLMNSRLWPIDPSERLELAPLRGAALAEAIAKPAERAGAFVEPRLLERLITDAQDEPGVLPLLQEAMVLLWERRDGHLLTLSAYEKLGQGDRNGLAVALATHADAALAQLAGPQRVTARRIFLRLVQFGQGRPDTRRQQPVSALRASADPVSFDQTLRHLTDHRLLTASGAVDGPERKVDIAHEALISSWSQFVKWIGEYKQTEQTRRRLESRAEEWAQLERRGGFLDETELRIAQEWASTTDARDLGIDSTLDQFIAASRARIQGTRRTYRVRLLVAAVMAVVLLLAGLSIYREWLRQRAIQLGPQITIEAGTSLIGLSAEDLRVYPEYAGLDAGVLQAVMPAWSIAVPAFQIDKHEVTQEQYCLCRQSGNCPGGPENVCDNNPLLPVSMVTLRQASDYCAWVGRRLPAEFEWEWAARGKERRVYPTGNKTPYPGQIYVDFEGRGRLTGPTTIADSSSDRTPEGVLDLAGNVREWTVSPYLKYDDPNYRNTFWPTPVPSLLYVARGSSFASGVSSAISVIRYPTPSDIPSSTIGFRCLAGVSLADLLRR